MSAKFYEKSRELGVKLFSVHKGFSYQSRTLGHLANPRTLRRPRLQNPDLTFVIYHSALKHGPKRSRLRLPTISSIQPPAISCGTTF